LAGREKKNAGRPGRCKLEPFPSDGENEKITEWQRESGKKKGGGGPERNTCVLRRDQEKCPPRQKGLYGTREKFWKARRNSADRKGKDRNGQNRKVPCLHQGQSSNSWGETKKARTEEPVEKKSVLANITSRNEKSRDTYILRRGIPTPITFDTWILSIRCRRYANKNCNVRKKTKIRTRLRAARSCAE